MLLAHRNCWLAHSLQVPTLALELVRMAQLLWHLRWVTVISIERAGLYILVTFLRTLPQKRFWAMYEVARSSRFGFCLIRIVPLFHLSTAALPLTSIRMPS